MPFIIIILAWLGGVLMCGGFIGANLPNLQEDRSYYVSEEQCIAETAKPCKEHWVKSFVVK